ncbi:MAG TPA: kelch repeat-containing protein, partial [Polyangia bacterium]
MPSSPLQLGAADSAPPTEAHAAGDVPGASEQLPVEVSLPARSTEPLRLAEKTTGMAIEVQAREVFNVVAQSADGYFVYPNAHTSGGTLLHRVVEDGAEDFVSFETRPAVPEVDYDLKLDKGVGGLRLVDGTLELLDANGAPRLRAAPPFIAGADGARTDATLAVEGCAVDTNPAGPWDRPVTAPGAAICTLRVRWPDEAVRYPAVLDPKWTTTGNLTFARQDHNLINLPLNGKVLAIGGRSTPTSTAGLASVEIYDKSTGTWSVTNPIGGGRWSASVTLLNASSNGATSQHVLVAGGINGTTSLNTAQLYNQTTGTWAAAANLNAPRHLHTATLLADGRVLVAGGMNGTSVLASAALYNPASGSGSWTATTGPIPPAGWRFGTATLVQTANGQLNNKVLLAGGNDGTHTLAAVFLFDPTQSAFSTLASMPSAREGGTAVAL